MISSIQNFIPGENKNFGKDKEDFLSFRLFINTIAEGKQVRRQANKRRSEKEKKRAGGGILVLDERKQNDSTLEAT